METRRLYRCVAALLLVCMLIAGVLTSMVYAADIDATLSTIQSSAVLSSLCSTANGSVGGKQVLSYESGNGLLRFSSKKYHDLDSDDKEEFMETALGYIAKQTSLSAKTRNQVYNFIANQDTALSASMKYLQTNTGADLVEAKKWFAPFEGVIGTILGFLCIIIFLFLGIGVLWDMFYLAIPAFQGLLDREEDNKKPFGISNEAWKAKTDVEKSNEYKSIVGLYLKRRIGVIMAVAVCIMYLVSGKIYDIIVFIIDAFM